MGDAGYTLSNDLMIPYPIEEQMDPQQALYNYLHSRTRIVVERSIGILKNRFRILKVPLNQKRDTIDDRSQTSQMARILKSRFVLHNLLIDIVDDTWIAGVHPQEEDDCGEIQTHGLDAPDSGLIRNGIAEYLYDNKDLLRSLYG